MPIEAVSEILSAAAFETHPNVSSVNLTSKLSITDVPEFDELFTENWTTFACILQNTVKIHRVYHIISQDHQ